MGLNETPSAERVHIGFFGVRNAGKSSVVNRITNQELSIVSEVKGTTTDAVKKPMELLPIGAVVIIDTAGIDDEGELGRMRVKSTEKVLEQCDLAVLVTQSRGEFLESEKDLLELIKARRIPFVVARNKSDVFGFGENSDTEVFVSAKENKGFEELKNALGKLAGAEKKEIRISTAS